MVLATDLLEQYQNLISNPVESNGCISGECVSTLHETSWVKIMVIRYQMAPDICTIEIEISLPPCIVDPAFPSIKTGQDEARLYIERHLSHLQYLLQLQEAGFSLGILSTEGIWSAVFRIDVTPNEDLFKILIPPEI